MGAKGRERFFRNSSAILEGQTEKLALLEYLTDSIRLIESALLRLRNGNLFAYEDAICWPIGRIAWSRHANFVATRMRDKRNWAIKAEEIISLAGKETDAQMFFERKRENRTANL